MIANAPGKKTTGARASVKVASLNDDLRSPADAAARAPMSGATPASRNNDLGGNPPAPADPRTRDASADDDAGDATTLAVLSRKRSL
eukprot:657231-Pyramimonas_sp.AAC.1